MTTPDATLPPDLAELLAHAREAQAAAYAPYSHYAVGAAVRTADGQVFTGANVENAMYGATVCAERVALWTAVAAGARHITAVAVATPSGGTPCGFCRQVLAEFAAPETPVVVAGMAGATPGAAPSARLFTLGELLPAAWGKGDLGA